jgi:hypothetical protein
MTPSPPILGVAVKAVRATLRAFAVTPHNPRRYCLDETLTLQRLGIEGALYRTLRSTNPIENLNGSIATYTRNVKR